MPIPASCATFAALEKVRASEVGTAAAAFAVAVFAVAGKGIPRKRRRVPFLAASPLRDSPLFIGAVPRTPRRV